MKLQESYQNFKKNLLPLYSMAEANIISNNIFETLLDLPASARLTTFSQEISASDNEKLQLALKKLLAGMPYAYVQQRGWFYNRPFRVTEAVLIPRPETEELVEILIKNAKGNPTILDIGTGSGCLPITLKLELPLADVTALDVSEEALKIAEQNAIFHNVDIDFKLMNFLEKEYWNSLESYDYIISNPPYIPIRNKDEMDKQVTDFEPDIALFVPDEDPLIFYKKIYFFSINHLKNNGKIFLETHYDNAKEVANIFRETYKTELIKDMSGKERFIVATQCQ